MQLLSIADLKRPEAELEPLLREVQNLGGMYTEFIKTDNVTYSYTVEDFAEDSRARGFHASELSGCFRRLVYAIWGTEKRPNPVNPNMKLRSRTGTALHGMIQTDLQRMAQRTQGRLYFQDEIKISPELQEVSKQHDIHSHCDGLFTFCRYYEQMQQWFPYIRAGLEIKTQSDADYEKTKKPKEEHLDQICIYQKCLDVPVLWLLYYNKSNSNFTTPYSPWLVRFDEKRWNKLVERMHSATAHMMHGQLPDREEGMPCTWCPYAWHCNPASLKRRASYGRAPISPSMLIRR